MFPTLIDQKSPFWRQIWPKLPTLVAKFRPFFAHISAKIRYFLTPSTLFIAFLCDNFTQISTIDIFFEKYARNKLEEKVSMVGAKKHNQFHVIPEHFRWGTRKGWEKI